MEELTSARELEADHRAAHPELGDREVALGLCSGLAQYGWLTRRAPDAFER